LPNETQQYNRSYNDEDRSKSIRYSSFNNHYFDKCMLRSE
jgi:hypothetical protein